MAEETSWWTRRYDGPVEDSDFTPEHSDNDPASDIENEATGGGDDEESPDRVAAAGGKDSVGGAALLQQKRIVERETGGRLF